jgi:dTDP-glucose 4,6-dehydratase
VRRGLPVPDLEHVLEHVGEAWQALAGARLFITGGTGFVGQWLLESLLWASGRRNLGVSATVLTRDPDRFRARSPHLAGHRDVALLRGNVHDFDFPNGEFPLVIHAAVEHAFDRDVEGTRRVLEFARTHATRRLLFTSSGAVYGVQPPALANIPEDYIVPLTVGLASDMPDYAQAKRDSEFLCVTQARQHGFAALIARLFAFVGPHLPLDRNFAVGNFIRDALAGGPIRIQDDGTPCRSYLYAADLAVWLWTILLRGEPSLPYNVGSAQAVTIAELARIVANVADSALRIEIVGTPVPGAPAARYVPSVERARQELGLQPIITLEEGVRRTYAWARAETADSSSTPGGFGSF